MTTRERLFLTPVEKFVKYGIIPWKLILNVLLVVLVTSQVVIINTQESYYILAATRSFYYFFFPTDYDFSSPEWYTYTVNSTVDAVQSAVANYYSISELSPDVFSYTTTNGMPGSDPLQPILEVTSFTDIDALFDPSRQFSGAKQTTSYNITADNYGPLDYSNGYPALRTFFHQLVTMTLRIPPLKNFAFGSLYRNCYEWSIAVEYDFTDRGQIQLTMDQDVAGTCDVYPSTAAALADKVLWLNFVIIILSVLHSGLLIKAIIRSLRLMRRLQKWSQEQSAYLATVISAATTANPAVLRADNGGISSSTSNNTQENSSDTTGVGVNAPAVSRSATAGQQSVQLQFHTDSYLDGGGDIFITATGPHATGGQRNTVVIAAGDAEQNAAQGAPVGYGSLNGGGATVQADCAAQATAQAINITWKSLSWRDKLRFVNGWSLWSMAADTCNIISCCINLSRKTAHLPSEPFHSLIMALGLALLWIGVLRYMEHNRAYFNIVLTLRRAGPRVLRFLVGVLPIFIAYALFSVVMFADRIPRFCDVRTAFVTLFANLNGDVVRETMMDIVAYHPVVGQIFFYTFISLHIYVILNIIIAVVEESYFITSEKTAEMEERLKEEAQRAGDQDGAAGPKRDSAAKADSDLQSAAVPARQVPIDVNVLTTPAKPDSNSIKGRPDSKLAVLLRLSEWDEVVTGQQIGKRGPTASSSALLDALDLGSTAMGAPTKDGDKSHS